MDSSHRSRLASLQAALALIQTMPRTFSFVSVLPDEKENSAALISFERCCDLDPNNTKARQYLIQTNQ